MSKRNTRLEIASPTEHDDLHSRRKFGSALAAAGLATIGGAFLTPSAAAGEANACTRVPSQETLKKLRRKAGRKLGGGDSSFIGIYQAPCDSSATTIWVLPAGADVGVAFTNVGECPVSIIFKRNFSTARSLQLESGSPVVSNSYTSVNTIQIVC